MSKEFHKRRLGIVTLALGAVLAAGSLLLPALAVTEAGPLLVQDTADPYAIEGINSSNGGIGVEGYGSFSGATGVTGVLGYVISPNSTGVTGYADNAGTAYGVYGFATNGNGVYGVSNSSSAASIYGYNNFGAAGVFGYSTGQGMLGISTATNGINGITRTSSTSNNFAGIAGYDQSTAGGHYGVFGTSANVAVFGKAIGNGTGVYGIGSGSGTGVYGNANGNGTAGYFYSYTGNALLGVTGSLTGGVGLVGLANGVGVEGDGYGTGAALLGQQAGTGPLIQLGTSSKSNTFMVQSTTLNRNGGALSGGADVQVSGDIFVYGKIFFNCNQYPATSSTICYDAQNTGTYGTTSSQRRPDGTRERVGTTEDVGNGQLVNGAAYVPIDASFAARMAAGRSYMVFLTPEGDSRGLYVVRKTTAGFVVRENQGGRSTLAFNYRIVATAADVEPKKLGSTVSQPSRPKFGSTISQESLRQPNPKTALMAHLKGATLDPEPRRLPQPRAPHAHDASRR